MEERVRRWLKGLIETWQDRVSIWSVPKSFQTLFFVAFSVIVFWGWKFVLSYQYSSPADLFGALASVAIFSASLSIILIEVSFLFLFLGGFLMVMASWLAEKFLNWEQRRFETKIDKTYGEGSVQELERRQNQPPDNRVFDILLRVRAGSINTDDATKEEIAACVDAGLLEWTLPEELRYTMSAATLAGPNTLIDFDSLPKLHDVVLTPQGQARIRARLGFL